MHKLRVKFAEVQAPVVQKMDNTICSINIYPLDSAIQVSPILICWVAIYLVDSAIQCLNNLGVVFKGIATSTLTPTLPVFTELLLQCILNF